MKQVALKALFLPVFLFFCCFLAGLYGVLHNQISYTVAPVYFHEFKFIQFHIASEFHDRIGAAFVGVRASWWMGLLIGLPVGLVGIWVKGFKAMVSAQFKAAMIVVIVALLTGLVVLGAALMAFDATNLPVATIRGVSDPVAFAQAGAMHDASYLGGGIGMVVALVYLTVAVVRSHRTTTRL